MAVSKLNRRDLVTACELAKCSLDKLGSVPMGQLAMAYLAEKRSGTTELSFDEWLDDDFEIEVEESNDEPDPS